MDRSGSAPDLIIAQTGYCRHGFCWKFTGVLRKKPDQKTKIQMGFSRVEEKSCYRERSLDTLQVRNPESKKIESGKNPTFSGDDRKKSNMIMQDVLFL